MLADLVSRCATSDPRPADMQEWQATHPNPWIHGRLYYRLLYEWARVYKPAVMVELGTDHGYGAWHMARGNPGALVIAVDVTLERVEPLLMLGNIAFLPIDTLDPNVSAAVRKAGPVGLIHFDDAHESRHLAAEFEAFDPLCGAGALQCFDDIAESADMRRAWEAIPEPKMQARALHALRPNGRPAGYGVRLKP